ncbi:hypothetical protein PXK58_02305 [Phaeobacter gallaeciensis]|uniref:hypothetical protein n=1 Tax=Phaeobacter gallaeciensis TaxID=60890 RepID=UPI00237FE8B1|nr:hypothetical protein [Phaeobacter gallaeciensis]MDE4272677.1 hypothetical protein [Phaeobacter gallaeciensis]MDE4298370.1 hypothetical protein [Phaeobacter gallaeciensis]MDE5183558.1 hypothetical protein [Phaeobacter gallaeciensis]
MSDVLKFTGKTPENHEAMAMCDCGSRSFKIRIFGASRDGRVFCANCEAEHTWLLVQEVEE